MSIIVATPSYAADFELFVQLHESVRTVLGSHVDHRVIVPASDVRLFREIDSKVLSVRAVEEFVPPEWRFVGNVSKHAPGRLSKIQYWSPLVGRPVRGWIVQQIVKLAVAAEIGRESSDGVLLVDSDVVLFREPPASLLDALRAIPLYQADGAVLDEGSEQAAWRTTAQALLGLRSVNHSADFISGLVPWSANVVVDLVSNIEGTGRLRWQDILSKQRSISECFLYGEYVRSRSWEQEVRVFNQSFCLSHWDARELTDDDMEGLLANIHAETFAVQIQSTSGTAMARRNELVHRAQAL